MSDTKRVEILSLQRYGDAGWRWTIRMRFPVFDADLNEIGADEVVSEHRTNGDGEGLWFIGADGEHRQTHGTLQYALAENESTARRQLIARAVVQTTPEWARPRPRS